MTTDYKIGTSFAIGSISLSGQAFLAPLSGITDVYFRRIARRFGASLVVSEMVASDALIRGEEEARLRSEGDGIDPHVVQLAGRDAGWMALAAKWAQESGAAIIDINMGCPAKKVTGGWAGSALMRELDRAARLIEAVAQAVSIPVTVKMRLGWDEASLNAPELARRAQEAGAKAVTVHGRTRQQFYKGRADWNAIAAITDAVSIPVVANGDIMDAKDTRACLKASRAQAVMIGRAALGKPWLVGEIARSLGAPTPPSPTSYQKTEAILEHYDGILSLYGKSLGLRHARKHLAAYADEAAHRQQGLIASERARLVTSQEPREVMALLQNLYTSRWEQAA